MPYPEEAHRKQKALLWEADGYDLYGEEKVKAKVQLDVRWENGFKEVIDEQGNTIGVDATVVVDRDIPIGSVMWEGGLNDIPGTAAVPDGDFKRVMHATRVPDWKGQRYRRVVFLMRLSDELPELS